MIKEFKRKDKPAELYGRHIHRLKKILDKQFATSEADNIAVFGEGLYRNIIAKEYKEQTTHSLLKAYYKNANVNFKDAELVMCISLDCEVDSNGKAKMDAAKHVMYFNYKHNAVDMNPNDKLLQERITHGISEEMTNDETQLTINKNIRDIVLGSDNTHILFFFMSDSMEKAERSSIN